MVNERFNVVSLGSKIRGTNDGAVISELSQTFKIKQKQAVKLLNTKNKIIKKDVDWETAEAYFKKLTKAGLAADIDITMSRELFLDSLEKKNGAHNQIPLKTKPANVQPAKTLTTKAISQEAKIAPKEAVNRSINEKNEADAPAALSKTGKVTKKQGLHKTGKPASTKSKAITKPQVIAKKETVNTNSDVSAAPVIEKEQKRIEEILAQSTIMSSLDISSELKAEASKSTAHKTKHNPKNLSQLKRYSSYIAYACTIGGVAFAAQYALSVIAPQTFADNSATTTGFIFVPLAAVCFPAILGIRRLIHVNSHNSTQKSSGSNISIEHPVHVSQSRFMVRHLRSHRSRGDLIYRSNSSATAKDLGMFLAQHFKKNPNGNRLVQTCQILWHGLTKKHTVKRMNGDTTGKEITPRLLTNHSANRPVAFLYKKKNTYIEIAAKHSRPVPLSSILMLALLGTSTGS